MGGIHIRVAYPQRCVRVLRPHCLGCRERVLERAPVGSPAARPYGRATVTTMEGPPAPPPRQVSETSLKTMLLKGIEANVCSSIKLYAGLGDAPIGALPGLGRGLQSL